MATTVETDVHCGLPPTVRRALEDVMTYLWDDELSHYAYSPLGEHGASHIFESLLVLSGWLAAGAPEPH
jgi:hypothetical protein